MAGAAGEAPPPRLWDDVFQRFYVPSREEVPELTEEELARIEERVDCWLMDAIGIL